MSGVNGFRLAVSMAAALVALAPLHAAAQGTPPARTGRQVFESICMVTTRSCSGAQP
jgi:hypothetical protein